MNLTTMTQFKNLSRALGVTLLVASIFFVTHSVYAQFDSGSYDSTGYNTADYSSTGYNSTDYGSTGYNTADYSSVGYNTPDYSSTGYNAPDYSSTGYNTSDYSSTGYNTSDYSSTGYNTPDYSSTGYNTSNYSSTGYNTPDYSSTGYNTPVTDYSSTGYNTPIIDYSSTGYNSPVVDYSSTGYNTPYSYYATTPSYAYASSYSYPSTYVNTYSPVYSQPACYSNCNPQPQPQISALSGSCVANPSNANTGSTVTWSVSGISGGVGNYSYLWSGTDGLSGSGSSISKIYNNAGTKSGTVTIRSGNQSIVRNCSTYINTPYVPPPTPVYNNLDASCVANQSSAYVGDSVSWSATSVTGGNGNYTYSWSGTDGLWGNGYSAYQTYNNPGTKYAYLTVYSNGQSINRTCSLYVNNRYNYTPITYVNPQPPVYPTVYPQPIYQAPFNGVSLTQVPYTGLADNMKIMLFTLALIVWSAIVTYVVIVRRRNNKLALATAGVSNETFESGEAEQSARQEVLMSHDNLLDSLEGFARNQNVIVSADALEAIANQAGHNQKRAQTLLSSLANRHANGTDWTTLDLSKVQTAIG